MDQVRENEKGITLIALVVTIIVLLILAGITISQLTGNGLFEKAKQAKEESTKAQICEEIQLEIMSIVTDCETDGINITNQVIQEKLENSLKGIEISADLTGTYKEYKYEIDGNYKVNIIGKSSDIMNLKVNLKIGTSYITINAQATSEEGEIKQYQYIIDGSTYSQAEATYIIENLEPESEHTVKIIAVDERQNNKESKEIIVKTEPRTYLYRYGNEYMELTNGWKEIYKTNYSLTPVSTNFKMDKLNDNIQVVSIGGIPIGGGAVLMGAAIGTNKRIDLSEYKYMYSVATVTLGKYSGASACEMTLESEDEFLVATDANDRICYTNPVDKKITKLDISNYSGMYSPAIYIQSELQLTSKANIYEVWLEK